MDLRTDNNEINSDDEHYDRSLAHEAQRVVDEIKFGVDEAEVSKVLENSDSLAFINLKTKEHETFCVELSINGYMIVSRKYDTIDNELRDKNLKHFLKYETVEALMHQTSPLFVKIFNETVVEKLKQIA
jgi:hypothetical protein